MLVFGSSCEHFLNRFFFQIGFFQTSCFQLCSSMRLAWCSQAYVHLRMRALRLCTQAIHNASKAQQHNHTDNKNNRGWAEAVRAHTCPRAVCQLRRGADLRNASRS